MKSLQSLLILLSISAATVAQDSESLIHLLNPVSKEDPAKLSPAQMAKVKHLEQSKAYKRVQLVKVGNLTKIQEKGVLTFTVPGNGETFTYFAQKVDVQSELDFTWAGASADKLSTAIFICKKGKLSGTFSLIERPFQLIYPCGRSFQLYSTDEGISVLTEGRTDLNLNCEVE